MCKKRELTEKSIIEEVHRPIGERSIQILMRKQLELMALINTVNYHIRYRRREVSMSEVGKYHDGT